MSAELLRRIKDLEERVKALEAPPQAIPCEINSVDLRGLEMAGMAPGSVVRQPLQKRPTITLKK